MHIFNFLQFSKNVRYAFFPPPKNTTNAHAFSGPGSGLQKHAFSSKKMYIGGISIFLKNADMHFFPGHPKKCTGNCWYAFFPALDREKHAFSSRKCMLFRIQATSKMHIINFSCLKKKFLLAGSFWVFFWRGKNAYRHIRKIEENCGYGFFSRSGISKICISFRLAIVACFGGKL